MCFRCLFFIATVKVNRIFLVVYNNHQAFHQRYWRLKSWLRKKMAVKNRLKNTKRNTRSSRPEVFCEKSVLRNFTKFTGKRLCQSLFPNKIAGLRPAILLKKRHWRSCFLVNFCEISKNIFFIEHLWLLLLSFLARSFFFKAMKLDALALWGKKI